MLILYLAPALHPKYKFLNFQLRESFPLALAENIREKLEKLHKLYLKYLKRKMEIRKTPHKVTNAQRHQMVQDTYASLTSVMMIFSDDKDDEVKTYLIERLEDLIIFIFCRRLLSA